MSEVTSDRRFARWSALSLVALIIVLSAVAALLPVFSGSERFISDALIQSLSEVRVAGGRFYRAPALPFDEMRYRKSQVRAEVFGLSTKDVAVGGRLQALMAAGSGRFQEAEESLRRLIETNPENPEILNDLGVVCLGMGEESPSNYFKAAMLFEKSAQLAPRAAAPRFNAVVAYQKAGIHDVAARKLQEYLEVESNRLWASELSTESPKDSFLIKRLQDGLSAGNLGRAKTLLDQYSSRYQQMAIDYALNPPESDSLDVGMEFALDHFAGNGSNHMLEAVVAPLKTAGRELTLESRRLVHKGIDAYFQSRFQESLKFYDLAEVAGAATGSVVDELWMKLNRGNSQLRSARIDPAGRRLDINRALDLLDEVEVRSRELNFDWLLGHALASKGVASMTTRSPDEILPMLNEAVDRLSAAGAPDDSVRPLYYAAAIHSMAGDSETSLRMAYRALRLTQHDDHVRLSELYWLIGLQLYRSGLEQYAMLLERQAVDEALASRNDGLIASITPYLAMIQVNNKDYESASKYMNEIKAARDRIEAPAERASTDLILNLLCSRIKIGTGDLNQAEECLTNNVRILDRQNQAAPDYFAQTLLQLEQIYLARGQVDSARSQLRRAIEVVEKNDAYLAAVTLRMPFENERRKLYDTAIDFEYSHDGEGAAWSFAQRYRSKLFLEFMRQMNPGIAGILDRAIDRNQVQPLIPSDVQVLEYVLLKDRLLIWLVSRDKFLSLTVPVTRAELEARVTDFIERINSQGSFIPESEQLYKLLIEPIESQLDPKRALAIIPDQALHRLNFPALYSPATKTFLIQQYAILESPNLTTLLSGNSGTPSRGPAVSFGARTDNTGATNELRVLREIYPDVRTFSGQAVLKPAFLSSLHEASVFHYAGHSQDAADPLRSSVLLDGEHEGPNSVTAVDISKRRMPASSVVVLASCDSSVGNSRDGIGMRGLTSAFLISGAGSVVGSLWLVDAESTSRLVLQFHKGFVRNRLPVAVALRNAQLEFVEEGAHPYYWSGFVVTGNLSALR